MYTRIIKPLISKSFFLFGARGTGKSSWLKANYAGEFFIDLLHSGTYRKLLARPELLESLISTDTKRVIIDEVQKIPELLNEVHRLIENKGIQFILTGSSARKLRRSGVNLLAGRAITRHMHPLTSVELGSDFNFKKSLTFGHLPEAVLSQEPLDFLNTYIETYLKEEILAEGLLRNLAVFARFLESASFSQAEPLNVANVARDCGIQRKVAEDYFQILEDLLLAVRLSVFSKRAKRDINTHPKFFLFDVGVFRALRPTGPLDTENEIDGAALETLVWQDLRALNDYLQTDYEIFFWRTKSKIEVDFVLYGPKGFFAIEVKRSHRVKSEDMDGLKAFKADYPEAKTILLYTGTEAYHDSGIDIIPAENWFGQNGEAMKRIFGGLKPKLKAQNYHEA